MADSPELAAIKSYHTVGGKCVYKVTSSDHHTATVKRKGLGMRALNPMVPHGAGHVPTATAQWLEDVPWQLFATLEFPSAHTRHETARRKFADMVNLCERCLGTRLCYVCAMESRSASGAIVPVHFHAAFTAIRRIPYQLVAGVWNEGIGRANSVGGDLARVEAYDLAMGGIEYIMKLITEPDCEWDLRNVHLFTPNVDLDSKLDHASLRSARRWQQQLEGAGLPGHQCSHRVEG